MTSFSGEVLEMVFDVVPFALIREWSSVVDACVISKLFKNERPVHDQ